MKTVKKNVYYCDFCKKRTLSASSMSVHEKHCTANPDRKCRICDNYMGVRVTVDEFKKRFKLHESKLSYPGETYFQETIIAVEWIGKPITMNEVCDLVDNCPNCKLAVIRQTGLNRYYFNTNGSENQFHFDYKSEMAEAMSDKNKEIDERYYYY